MANVPIHSWYPNFGKDGNFEEVYGWDVVLRHIFTVLVTRPNTRQWQPEFGCRLLDMLFEVNENEASFENVIKEAFRWVPYVRLESVSCKIEPMANHNGKKASIKLKITYSGETKDVVFEIPPQLDLLNGTIYDIKVRRKG